MEVGEGEERKPVTVARRVGESEVAVAVVVVVVAVSSERLRGVRRVTWPKRRPSRGEGEVEKRWMREARVGPEIAIFCNGGGSSIGGGGGRWREKAREERERRLAVMFGLVARATVSQSGCFC